MGRYSCFPFLTYRHANEVVETTICRVFENTEYTLYATVVDGGCIHIPASKQFSSSSTAVL